jgi:hypothetical protein
MLLILPLETVSNRLLLGECYYKIVRSHPSFRRWDPPYRLSLGNEHKGSLLHSEILSGLFMGFGMLLRILEAAENQSAPRINSNH